MPTSEFLGHQVYTFLVSIGNTKLLSRKALQNAFHLIFDNILHVTKLSKVLDGTLNKLGVKKNVAQHNKAHL